jgi:citrate lyase subunit beta/citryl-CoA lyase
LVTADLKEIVQKGIDGVVIPKVNSAKELKKIEKTISSLEKKRKIKGIRLMPSIESALGVVNCYEIASSSKRIDALVFGIFDLLNDMGIEYTKGNPRGAKYSRYKVPVAATAAGVASIDGIWQDLKDKSGFVKDCQVGRSLGYAGKSVIHPDQIKTVHKIFHPSKPEIEWAKKVCNVYEKSTKKGRGATVVEGKMIDEVHYKRAKALLEI